MKLTLPPGSIDLALRVPAQEVGPIGPSRLHRHLSFFVAT
jgi:hypothetical protein